MRLNQRRDERGSITLFYVMGAFVMIAVLGLAVDLSGMVYAKQRAFDVAAQAARVGGEAIHSDSIMTGQTLTIDASKGVAAAQGYISQSDMTGTVSINGNTVTATTRYSWTPIFLGAFGVGARDFTGTGTARIVRAVQGTER